MFNLQMLHNAIVCSHPAELSVGRFAPLNEIFFLGV